MKIKNISIRNLRSFGDNPIEFPMNALTALVGGNSSGKSNVLKALDLFFNYSKRIVSVELFHNGNLSVPIEISVTFAALNDAEKRTFKRNLGPDGSLRIKQIVSANSSDVVNSSDSGEDDDTGELSNVHQERRGVRKLAVTAAIEWLNYSGLPAQSQLDGWWAADLIIGEEDFKSRFPAGKPTPAEFQVAIDKFWEDDFELIPQIEWLNKPPTKALVKSWWKLPSLVAGGFDFKAHYFAGVNESPSPEQFSAAVNDFWLNHEDLLTTMQHEGSEKILGWANKLKGNLPRVLLVPAVRHFEDEIRVNKTGPFGVMIHWLLGDVSAKRRSTLQRLVDKVMVSAFSKKPRSQQEQEQIGAVREGLKQVLANTELGTDIRLELEETLNDVFSVIAGEAPETGDKSRIALVAAALNELVKQQFDITLDFAPGIPQLQKVLTSNLDLIGDDGYISSITEKGDGVQRAIIFTILRAYAKLRDQIETEAEHRNTIFLIEEPENCLHPSVRRATYSLLRRLSEGEDQVVYTTHDGYFVDVRYFDEIRIFRRAKTNMTWTTTVSFLPISHIVEDARNRYKKDLTETEIREHFGRFYHPAKNEGFFARRVLLVEGHTEEYALPIYFKALDYDVDLEQTAIINAESVLHIDSLFIIFNELGIPCYVVFDGDKPHYDFSDPTKITSDQRREVQTKGQRNVDLLKIFGAPDLLPAGAGTFFPSTVFHPRVTVFEHDVEAEFRVGMPNYTELKAEATKRYQESKPLIARHIAQAVAQDPTKIPQLISQLLAQVKVCQHHGTSLMLDHTPP